MSLQFYKNILKEGKEKRIKKLHKTLPSNENQSPPGPFSHLLMLTVCLALQKWLTHSEGRTVSLNNLKGIIMKKLFKGGTEKVWIP